MESLLPILYFSYHCAFVRFMFLIIRTGPLLSVLVAELSSFSGARATPRSPLHGFVANKRYDPNWTSTSYAGIISEQFCRENDHDSHTAINPW